MLSFARIILGLTSFLVALPIQAQESKPSCLQVAMELAEKEWQPDPEEATRIAATNGKVARIRNLLRIKTETGFDETFVDIRPEAMQDEDLARTGRDYCGSDNQRFRFERIVGKTAIIEVLGYEDISTDLIDTANGSKMRVPAFDAVVSPEGRYFVLSKVAYSDGSLVFQIFDTKRHLRLASLDHFTILGEDVTTTYDTPPEIKWTGPDTLGLQVYAYGSPPQAAIIRVDNLGIKLSLPASGREISTSFAPIK